jgi:hypothetical protein
VTPTPASLRYGPSSGSSSPTTSRPIARRWRIAPTARIRNFRVPKANLEGVYGVGPVGSPYLYRRDDPAKLLLSPSGGDVPRNHEGIALIGDPGNDVHLFLSQMLVAFIELHNRLVDRLRADGVAEPEVVEDARRAATWHYQHVILREFLPGLSPTAIWSVATPSGSPQAKPSRTASECPR